MKILGISGRKGSGKDALCILLAGKRPVVRHAFADELKQEVAFALGLRVQDIENRKDFFRPILKWWGDWRRDKNPDYFVETVQDQILLSEYGNDTYAVVTDVRYPNEAKMIETLGGKLIRIERDGGDGDTHSSENSMGEQKFDVVIQNNGTLSDLAAECGRLIEWLEKNY